MIPSGSETNPEQSTNEPVRETSRGFINRVREGFVRAFDRNPGIFIGGVGSTAAAVLFPLSRGDISSALFYGIATAVACGAIAVGADRHSRHLEEQSARMKAQWQKPQEEKP